MKRVCSASYKSQLSRSHLIEKGLIWTVLTDKNKGHQDKINFVNFTQWNQRSIESTNGLNGFFADMIIKTKNLILRYTREWGLAI